MKQYQIKYEALRIYDEPFGPMGMPPRPPKVNPDDILPLIIDKKRKEKDDREQPYYPLIIPDEEEPYKPH